MDKKNLGITLGSIAIVLVCVVGLFIAVPYYNVWQQEMSGRAEFAKAEQNRKIKIEEAKANLELKKIYFKLNCDIYCQKIFACILCYRRDISQHRNIRRTP